MSGWIGKITLPAAMIGITATMVMVQHQISVALSPKEVNEIARNISVGINGGESRGSGSIIAREGNQYAVLTNWHVVKNAGEYTIDTIDGQSHSATGKIRLNNADLAILYFTSNNSYSTAKKGNSDRLVEGQTIHIAGYPSTQQVAKDRTYRFLTGRLTGFLSPSDIKEGYELIYSVQAIPGMSGGPILDQNGQLIGVYSLAEIDTAASNPPDLYGIPINTAEKLAIRSGISLDSPIATSQLSIPESTATAPTLSQDIGFEVQGSQQLNYLNIPQYQYIGECPGRKVDSIRAMFTSQTTEPAENRRVVIRNITRGVSSNPFPYTDREYDRGRASEVTKITLGAEHRGSHFVAIEGQNQFEYDIKEGETVIESGSFTAQIESTPIIIERYREPVEQKYCAYDVPLYHCDKKYIRIRTVYRCLH